MRVPQTPSLLKGWVSIKKKLTVSSYDQANKLTKKGYIITTVAGFAPYSSTYTLERGPQSRIWKKR